MIQSNSHCQGGQSQCSGGSCGSKGPRQERQHASVGYGSTEGTDEGSKRSTFWPMDGFRALLDFGRSSSHYFYGHPGKHCRPRLD